ncbi:MAG: serine/threonine-protein kinase [Myxococcales bacterium]
MTQPGANALVGHVLGEKFFVRRQIGSGGMGAVYEAEHLVTKRVGALKLLHATRASVKEVVARFVREASAAAYIENPHIVVTYDAGNLPSGEPYLFMELLRGRPLSALIEERGKLPFDEARALVVQAADALAAAHLAGVVHRDVKPDNLFACEGPTPFVKVLDFGISKFAPQLAKAQPLTVDGAPMGSPHYMSPEQVVGKRDVDFRTDIYSLGVVLYECLTGTPPFTAPSLSELGVKIFEGRYQPASAIVPALPPGLDEFLAMAMAVEPSERHASIGEFRLALLALAGPGTLAQSTLVIEPSPVPRRVTPRRARLGFALTAGCVAALMIPLGWLGLRAAAPPSSPVASSPVRVGPPGVARSRPPTDELRARVEGAPSEAPPAASSAAPSASASSGPLSARPAQGGRRLSGSSSRARSDGLVDANPF